MIARILLGASASVALVACGGGNGKKTVKKPKPNDTSEVKPPPAPAETEADREAARLAIAHAFAAEGSKCLPAALKDANAPRLEIAQVGSDAVVCAVDTDVTRLAGPLACWDVDLTEGALKYAKLAPLPGHSLMVKLDDRGARGFELPADAQLPSDGVAYMAWSTDNAKVAVLAGDHVHLFDVGTQAHETSFSIRGDKGVTSNPTGIHWVGEAIFIEGSDNAGQDNAWVFHPDGTAIGAIEEMGKPPKLANSKGGTFIALDKERAAVADHGWTTVTTYNSKDGARTKIVRKVPKSPCKTAETTAYWTTGAEGVGAKCGSYMATTMEPFVGADALAGERSFLVVLRGARLGEVAVMDAKTLSEKRVMKLAWCGSDAAPAGE